MPIEHIHTYLVDPRKGADEHSPISGNAVPASGKLFGLLNDIYTKSDSECDIAISFNHASDGSQQNQCRNLFIDYVRGPTVDKGRHIADRLEKVTTHRSGLGLLFLIAGKEGHDHKFVISRFPADSAILAEEVQRKLSVEFLERVFMKKATAYKAAVYKHSSPPEGFWFGLAIDKQIKHRGSAFELLDCRIP